MAIIVLLALFPILYLFDTRLAIGALLVAIVALYRKRTAVSTRPGEQRGKPERPQTAWKDPWGTGGLGH